MGTYVHVHLMLFAAAVAMTVEGIPISRNPMAPHLWKHRPTTFLYPHRKLSRPWLVKMQEELWREESSGDGPGEDLRSSMLISSAPTRSSTSDDPYKTHSPSVEDLVSFEESPFPTIIDTAMEESPSFEGDEISRTSVPYEGPSSLLNSFIFKPSVPLASPSFAMTPSEIESSEPQSYLLTNDIYPSITKSDESTSLYQDESLPSVSPSFVRYFDESLPSSMFKSPPFMTPIVDSFESLLVTTQHSRQPVSDDYNDQLVIITAISATHIYRNDKWTLATDFTLIESQSADHFSLVPSATDDIVLPTTNLIELPFSSYRTYIPPLSAEGSNSKVSSEKSPLFNSYPVTSSLQILPSSTKSEILISSFHFDTKISGTSSTVAQSSSRLLDNELTSQIKPSLTKSSNDMKFDSDNLESEKVSIKSFSTFPKDSTTILYEKLPFKSLTSEVDTTLTIVENKYDSDRFSMPTLTIRGTSSPTDTLSVYFHETVSESEINELSDYSKLSYSVSNLDDIIPVISIWDIDGSSIEVASSSENIETSPSEIPYIEITSTLAGESDSRSRLGLVFSSQVSLLTANDDTDIKTSLPRFTEFVTSAFNTDSLLSMTDFPSPVTSYMMPTERPFTTNLVEAESTLNGIDSKKSSLLSDGFSSNYLSIYDDSLSLQPNVSSADENSYPIRGISSIEISLETFSDWISTVEGFHSVGDSLQSEITPALTSVPEITPADYGIATGRVNHSMAFSSTQEFIDSSTHHVTVRSLSDSSDIESSSELLNFTSAVNYINATTHTQALSSEITVESTKRILFLTSMIDDEYADKDGSYFQSIQKSDLTAETSDYSNVLVDATVEGEPGMSYHRSLDESGYSRTNTLMDSDAVTQPLDLITFMKTENLSDIAQSTETPQEEDKVYSTSRKPDVSEQSQKTSTEEHSLESSVYFSGAPEMTKSFSEFNMESESEESSSAYLFAENSTTTTNVHDLMNETSESTLNFEETEIKSAIIFLPQNVTIESPSYQILEATPLSGTPYLQTDSIVEITNYFSEVHSSENFSMGILFEPSVITNEIKFKSSDISLGKSYDFIESSTIGGTSVESYKESVFLETPLTQVYSSTTSVLSTFDIQSPKVGDSSYDFITPSTIEETAGDSYGGTFTPEMEVIQTSFTITSMLSLGVESPTTSETSGDLFESSSIKADSRDEWFTPGIQFIQTSATTSISPLDTESPKSLETSYVLFESSTIKGTSVEDHQESITPEIQVIRTFIFPVTTLDVQSPEVSSSPVAADSFYLSVLEQQSEEMLSFYNFIKNSTVNNVLPMFSVFTTNFIKETNAFTVPPTVFLDSTKIQTVYPPSRSEDLKLSGTDSSDLQVSLGLHTPSKDMPALSPTVDFTPLGTKIVEESDCLDYSCQSLSLRHSYSYLSPSFIGDKSFYETLATTPLIYSTYTDENDRMSPTKLLDSQLFTERSSFRSIVENVTPDYSTMLSSQMQFNFSTKGTEHKSIDSDHLVRPDHQSTESDHPTRKPDPQSAESVSTTRKTDPKSIESDYPVKTQDPKSIESGYLVKTQDPKSIGSGPPISKSYPQRTQSPYSTRTKYSESVDFDQATKQTKSIITFTGTPILSTKSIEKPTVHPPSIPADVDSSHQWQDANSTVRYDIQIASVLAISSFFGANSSRNASSAFENTGILESDLPKTEIRPTPSMNLTLFQDNNYWILTILEAPEVGHLPENFSHTMELRLANAYGEAFRAKDKKDSRGFANHVIVKILSLTNDLLLDQLSIVYVVERGGVLLPASLASEYLNFLRHEQLKQFLGLYAIIKAKPFRPPESRTVTQAIPVVTIVCSILGFLLLVFCCFCVYCRCCRPKQVQEPSPSSSASGTLQRSLAKHGQHNRKHQMFQEMAHHLTSEFVSHKKQESSSPEKYLPEKELPPLHPSQQAEKIEQARKMLKILESSDGSRRPAVLQQSSGSSEIEDRAVDTKKESHKLKKRRKAKEATEKSSAHLMPQKTGTEEATGGAEEVPLSARTNASSPSPERPVKSPDSGTSSRHTSSSETSTASKGDDVTGSDDSKAELLPPLQDLIAKSKADSVAAATDTQAHLSKVRQRISDLLDDAFALAGGRKLHGSLRNKRVNPVATDAFPRYASLRSQSAAEGNLSKPQEISAERSRPFSEGGQQLLGALTDNGELIVRPPPKLVWDHELEIQSTETDKHPELTEAHNKHINFFPFHQQSKLRQIPASSSPSLPVLATLHEPCADSGTLKPLEAIRVLRETASQVYLAQSAQIHPAVIDQYDEIDVVNSLREGEPVAELIQAIKEELQRFSGSLPGCSHESNA